MRTVRYIPRYTVSDYKEWEGEWELIEGIPSAMSPSPVWKHQRLASLLLRQIGEQLEQTKNCAHCAEVHELDWIVNEETVLRPDIAIICDQKGDFITSPPALIIEILSPSTAYKDRQVKFEIYMEKGVQYYILLDPDKKTKNIFLLKDGKYELQLGVALFSMHNDCSIRIDFEKALTALE